MVERNTPIDIDIANDCTLRSLARAIYLSNRELSVVLVCSDYKILRDSILQKLTGMLGESDKI
jgi:hypothetical protein